MKDLDQLSAEDRRAAMQPAWPEGGLDRVGDKSCPHDDHQVGASITFLKDSKTWTADILNSPRGEKRENDMDQATLDRYPAYQQRVLTEREDIEEKLGKLRSFFNSSTYAAMAETQAGRDEQDRLLKQADIMDSYRAILVERITAWTMQ